MPNKIADIRIPVTKTRQDSKDYSVKLLELALWDGTRDSVKRDKVLYVSHDFQTFEGNEKY